MKVIKEGLLLVHLLQKSKQILFKVLIFWETTKRRKSSELSSNHLIINILMAFLISSKSVLSRHYLHSSSTIQALATRSFSNQAPVTQVKIVEKERTSKQLKDSLMVLTKFKLSLLNSVASYSTFYFCAPLAGVGLLESALFMVATQSVAMST